jgi:thyroid adenoma-associated protein
VVRGCPAWRRLLEESAPRLNQLPGEWLQLLLARLARPGQCRDDVVRRSAGLPYAVVAIFLAEPLTSHKVPRARGLPRPRLVVG